MSAVKLDGVEHKDGNLTLMLSGIDLLDGTPIIDVKPYLPYSDAMSDASAGFADTRQETQMTVEFSKQAYDFIKNQNDKTLFEFIENVLKQDPRPAYKKQKAGMQAYGMTLYHYNIRWQVNGTHNLITEITLES
jgi:hypothetical protein